MKTRAVVCPSGHSDGSGYYDFDGLPPAEYRVSVNADSFAPLTTQPIPVEVDRRVRQDLHAAIAGQGTQVVVRAEAPAVQTDSGELGAVLDQALVDGLPLNERDFLHLALLLPGITPPVAGSQLSSRGTFAMHADGGREELITSCSMAWTITIRIRAGMCCSPRWTQFRNSRSQRIRTARSTGARAPGR